MLIVRTLHSRWKWSMMTRTNTTTAQSTTALRFARPPSTTCSGFIDLNGLWNNGELWCPAKFGHTVLESLWLFMISLISSRICLSDQWFSPILLLWYRQSSLLLPAGSLLIRNELFHWLQLVVPSYSSGSEWSIIEQSAEHDQTTIRTVPKILPPDLPVDYHDLVSCWHSSVVLAVQTQDLLFLGRRWIYCNKSLSSNVERYFETPKRKYQSDSRSRISVDVTFIHWSVIGLGIVHSDHFLAFRQEDPRDKFNLWTSPPINGWMWESTGGSRSQREVLFSHSIRCPFFTLKSHSSVLCSSIFSLSLDE